jgi:hypothetical protein
LFFLETDDYVGVDSEVEDDDSEDSSDNEDEDDNSQPIEWNTEAPENKFVPPPVAQFQDSDIRFNLHNPPIDSESSSFDILKTFMDKKALLTIVYRTKMRLISIFQTLQKHNFSLNRIRY